MNVLSTPEDIIIRVIISQDDLKVVRNVTKLQNDFLRDVVSVIYKIPELLRDVVSDTHKI